MPTGEHSREALWSVATTLAQLEVKPIGEHGKPKTTDDPHEAMVRVQPLSRPSVYTSRLHRWPSSVTRGGDCEIVRADDPRHYSSQPSGVPPPPEPRRSLGGERKLQTAQQIMEQAAARRRSASMEAQAQQQRVRSRRGTGQSVSLVNRSWMRVVGPMWLM